MTSKIVPNFYRIHVGRQFLESVNEVANTAYYMFLGKHMPIVNSEIELVDTVDDTHIEVYHNMIQGKRVGANDTCLLIRNVPYETNKVFTMYDDADEDLLDSDYYAVVNASSYYHIYKCLDNNMGANSTVQPNFAHITGSNTQMYQTSDGYRWKYMYSVSSAQRNQFATSDYFPVFANTTVESQAVDRVLDIIAVEGTGRGYDNYIVGSLGSNDLRINGNTVLYNLSTSGASSVNGFYTGCLLYISTGTGAGSYSLIEDYFVNGNGNFVVLENELETAPVNGSEYEIYPGVTVLGSGVETVNVVARALVNSENSNSIHRVEVLDRGAGYEYFAANVVANDVVGVLANAEIRAIYSPFGGHGADAAAELGSSWVCLSVKFANSESNTLLVTNDYAQIGLLRDPLFADVRLTVDDESGTFLVGETACKVGPIRIDALATINTVSTTVSSNGADFSNQLEVGNWVYLYASDNTGSQVVQVAEVTNSSQIVLESNGLFACTETYVYLANPGANGIVLSVNSSTVFHLANVQGVFQTNDLVVGQSTGARGYVANIARNDVDKGFNSFIQLHKYISTLDSGTFTEDEIVYQGALSTANAALHSAIVDGANVTLYTSNQVGAFTVGGGVIVGNTSGATATILAKYSPEIVFGSGRVLYLEDVDAISREADQSETIKIIFEF